MLAMSPLCPSLGWDYPIELGVEQPFNLDHYWNNLDSLVNPNYSSSQVQENNYLAAHDDHVVIKRSGSPPTESSGGGHVCTAVIAKKVNHNASERHRRKRINSLYSSLRALLPAIDNMKKLSIPATVTRVLEYIPKLQKEVDDLIHKRDKLSSKISDFPVTQADATSENFIQAKIPTIKDTITRENQHQSCSISVNKLSDREIVIQISTLERLSLFQVLLQLENDGFLILDVSTFQSFGGSIFYNIHLCVIGCNIIKSEKLEEDILIMIQKQNHQ